MILDVDVLCASIVFQIMSKGNGALIVAIDEVLSVNVVVDLSEKAKEPDLLLEGVEDGHVFQFCVGEGDCCLFL